MLSIQEFHKQWAERHDFEYDDSDLLSKQYPSVLFKDIPQAWMCCIYDHLYKIKSLSKIISISQIFGFPVIQYENDIENCDFNIIKNMEHSLMCIDDDLHNQIDALVLN